MIGEVVGREGGGGTSDGSREGAEDCDTDDDAREYRKRMDACFLDKTGWSSSRDKRLVNLRYVLPDGDE